MVKTLMLKILNGKSLLAVLVFLSFAIIYALAADTFIKYLPRNEDMDTKFQSYDAAHPRRISETSCPEAQDKFRDAESCRHCVQDLKPRCPDCCLNFDPRAIRCTPEHSADYNCSSQAFASEDCANVACPQSEADCPAPHNPLCANYCNNLNSIPACQEQGCPNPQPNSQHCVFDNDTETWICNDNDLQPVSSGCSKIANITQFQSPCLGPYYDIIPSPCHGHGEGASPQCFRYALTNQFKDCLGITSLQQARPCVTYTDTFEKCEKGTTCCKKATCSTALPPGFENNCNVPLCQERINFLACDTYTAAECIRLSEEATACLLEGGCSGCFQEIDSNFSYRFVAKSRNALTIIWQVATTPHLITDVPDLFTKVKVFEVRPDGSEQLIHDSVVHQKSLQAAFSIFCATHINNNVLTQGKPYIVRLYYFIPEVNPGVPNPDLYVDINSVRLILIKVRE